MARTTINTHGVPAGTIVASDLSYPLTGFSSTGIDDNADATAITIDSSENVGIGTTSPATKLQVNGQARVTDGTTNIDSISAGGVGYFGTQSDHSLAIRANDIERMRVTTAGTVGIGISSPAAKFHVHGTGDLIRCTSTNSSSGGAQLDLLHFSPSPADGDDHASINFGGYYSGTSQAYGSAIRSNWTDVSAREACLKFYTRDDSTFYNHMQLNHFGHLLVGREDNSSHSSRVKIVNGGGSGYESSLDFCYESKDTVRARINTDSSGGRLEFHTFDSDGLQERMRLTSNGELLLNATSFNDQGRLNVLGTTRCMQVSNSDAALFVDKDSSTNSTSQIFVRFTIHAQATGSGQINANGSGQAALASYSDERLKENITNIPSQLDNILSLRPVEFDYIESEGGGHQTSFIAQEFEKVYPDAISEREDGMKILTGWGKTEAVLVKAIQELSAKVAALEAK